MVYWRSAASIPRLRLLDLDRHQPVEVLLCRSKQFARLAGQQYASFVMFAISEQCERRLEGIIDIILALGSEIVGHAFLLGREVGCQILRPDPGDGLGVDGDLGRDIADRLAGAAIGDARRIERWYCSACDR